MKITNIKTYRMQVPLVRPFRIALGLITHAVSCLVEIETDAGITGYGEGSPGPLITGENLDGTIATVERMKEKLIGMDPRDMEAIYTVMQVLQRRPSTWHAMTSSAKAPIFRCIRFWADFPARSRQI